MKILTLDDFELSGKTILLRVDMNCPIEPVTEKISSTKRIEETIETIKALSNTKLVIISHQDRVGSRDLEWNSMQKFWKIYLKRGLHTFKM